MSLPAERKSTAAGGAVYSIPFASYLLSYLYDFVVLRFANSFAWQCPTVPVLLPFFRARRTSQHLDIGVGSGWYLKHGDFAPSSQVTLVDINADCLQVSQRIGRNAGLQVDTRVHDVEMPLVPPLPRGQTKSISLMYLLHCMPGPPSRKVAIFTHLKQLLDPTNGVLFGATILGKGVEHNLLGRFFMRTYNKKGIFGNADDDAQVFITALQANFEQVEVDMHGVVLLFTARKPKP